MGERKVFKFPVRLMARWIADLPAGAQMLAVQMQDNLPYVWALVDPSAPHVTRRFRLAGTGHPITGNVDYIGTFQMDGGALVFHLFEETP